MNKNRNYTKIAKGVYKTSYGAYRVRRMIKGRKYDASFTNKATAVKYYNKLG